MSCNLHVERLKVRSSPRALVDNAVGDREVAPDLGFVRVARPSAGSTASLIQRRRSEGEEGRKEAHSEPCNVGRYLATTQLLLLQKFHGSEASTLESKKPTRGVYEYSALRSRGLHSALWVVLSLLRKHAKHYVP